MEGATTQVHYYYSGLNLFAANKQEVSLATPYCLNVRRAEIEDLSSSSAPATLTENRLKPRDVALRISISWKTMYLVEDEKLHVVGECDEAVSSCLTDARVKDVGAAWASLIILTANDEIMSISDSEPHAKTIAVDLGVPKCALRAVAAGERHVLVLTESGEVFAVVADQKASFRCLNLSTKVKSVVCGKEHVLLLTQLGQLLSYGSGSRGQLGHGSIDDEEQPKLIEALDGLSVLCASAGGWHSTVVSGIYAMNSLPSDRRDIGDIYVWGWNESGQLGLPCRKLRERRSKQGVVSSVSDDTVTVLARPQVLFSEDDELNFVDASCGSRHTVALTADHRLFAWGWNNYGQLGTGDLESTDSPCEVSFFSNRNLRPIKIKCGYWSTVFVCTDTLSADDW